MKKIISLILAFVMIASLSVISFADRKGVILLPVEPDEKELIVLDPLEFTDENESVFVAGKGGTFYVMFDPEIEYTKVKVEASGCVTAKIIDYDPTIYAPIEGITYKVVKRNNKDHVEDYGMTYEDAVDLAKQLNHDYKTISFVVRPDVFINMIEIAVEDNYTAFYKEGEVVIRAHDVNENEDKKATLKIVRDVVIFDPDTVEYCAEHDVVLDCTDERGYSDYEASLYGYDKLTFAYNLDPTVIATNAFRKIAGKDIEVENNDMTVKITKIANGQKGINFDGHPVKAVDTNKDDKTDKITFGFKCTTPVLTPFEITVDTGYTYFTLLKEFNLRLEEKDVITYTVLKNGKVYSEFTIDYGKEDLNTEVKLILDGPAGEVLGDYEIVVGTAEEVKPEEEAGETNPDTGAEITWFYRFWLWLFG